jgi:hypothetical protein
MKVEEIPSDELFVMTEMWHRAFNAAGCNPMCHACKNMLPVGSNFKLGTIQKENFVFGKGNPNRGLLKVKTGTTSSREVMLCESCTPETYKYLEEKMFIENKKEYDRLEALHAKNGGGCFRINGKIVI